MRYMKKRRGRGRKRKKEKHGTGETRKGQGIKTLENWMRKMKS